ncbi:MAG: tRNA (adenosine(37)-N6)-dimethylallyltransferase MiaA, partial [Firmicutes bacterium]|nr:tRNA (adenosine(37)-N6)-dimethylallyltransferase MiaA [Bacillota bacterium]
GEVISADSAQIYRGLEIGSAKITRAEQQGVPHHLMDMVNPTDSFSVADFQEQAEAAARDIWRRGRLPIVVGGTGLWIRALIRHFRFESQDQQEVLALRAQIDQAGEKWGWEAVRRVVRLIDPVAWARIASQDHRRLSRVLEVFWLAQSRLTREEEELSPFRVDYWVVSRPMTELRQRIAARYQLMLSAGFDQEVLNLLASGVDPSSQSLSAIGYREMVQWARGWISTAERDRLIVLHSSQYAKRQMTWFRGEPLAKWIDLSAWGTERACTVLTAAGEKLKSAGAD